MTTRIKASVVICTRNRAQSLRRTLQSLRRLVVDPQISWEVVVVDNGSEDATAEVVESFVRSLPIRRVVEETPGLSVARNRGILEANGEFILWTDDDVEVDNLWLTSYVKAFELRPEVAIFGGRSVPILEQPAVPWFVAKSHLLGDLLAAREYGPNPVEISVQSGVMPFGLNYAVRADLQRRFPYDPTLGVAPGRRRSGEEVDFFQRALAAGFRGLCLPEPLVYHLVPLSRQTVGYVRAYYESAGETWLVMRAERHRTPLSRARIWTKFVVARLAYTAVRWTSLSIRHRWLIRDAFHTGVVQQLATARKVPVMSTHSAPASPSRNQGR